MKWNEKKIVEVWEAIRKEWKLSDVTEMLHIAKGVEHESVRVNGAVPQNLSVEQKGKTRKVCSDILERLMEGLVLLKSVIIVDKNQIFTYDSETKRIIHAFEIIISTSEENTHTSVEVEGNGKMDTQCSNS